MNFNQQPCVVNLSSNVYMIKWSESSIHSVINRFIFFGVQIHSCKTVHTVFFYFFQGLKIWSFNPWITRYHNLRKKSFFKENKTWFEFAHQGLGRFERFIWVHWIKNICPFTPSKSSKVQLQKKAEFWVSNLLSSCSISKEKDLFNLIRKLRNFCTYNFF